MISVRAIARVELWNSHGLQLKQIHIVNLCDDLWHRRTEFNVCTIERLYHSSSFKDKRTRGFSALIPISIVLSSAAGVYWYIDGYSVVALCRVAAFCIYFSCIWHCFFFFDSCIVDGTSYTIAIDDGTVVCNRSKEPYLAVHAYRPTLLCLPATLETSMTARVHTAACGS